MRNTLIKSFLSVGLFALISCSTYDMRLVRERAGANWGELEKVIERYELEGDLQKVKAVDFLIRNMPYHSYLDSEGLQRSKEWFRHVRHRSPDDYKMISDSLADIIDISAGMKRIWDVQVLDSAFLCDNIDMAFKVWREQPWGKNVDFDSFCENILPYRIGDEVPQSWRKEYYDRYHHIIDGFVSSADSLDIEDPAEAYKYVEYAMRDINPPLYTSISPFSFPHVGPETALYNSGTCLAMCDFMMYVCRSLGIPLTLNNRLNDGHHWTTCIGKNGDEHTMSYLYKPVVPNYADPVSDEVKTRVYRLRYAVNKEELGRMRRGREKLPLHFRIPLYENVTSHYTDQFVDELVIPDAWFKDNIYAGTVMYLCSIKKDSWTPEEFTRKGLLKTVFSDIQKGEVLCVAVNENGVYRPVTDPFMLVPYSDEVRFFVQDGIHENVVLKSKYHLERDENDYRQRMVGGVFEGALYPDFRNADTLLVISEKPDRLYTTAKVFDSGSYRYLRYRGAAGSFCGVAEITFYGEDGLPLEYLSVSGTSNIEDPKHEFFNVYDGNPSTSFEYPIEDGGWAGIELKEAARVSRIVYTPQNTVNYIYAGDEYELLYYDDGWKSLGVRTAVSDSLLFRNVPSGNLLYLKNHSAGVQEMVFTYEDGRQVFYGCGLYLPPAEDGFQ